MDDQHIALHDDSRTLLKIIGLASQSTAHDVVFEYQAIPGYPIGWMLHPGLSGGACAVDTGTLRALREHGCLVCDGDPVRESSTRCSLTDQGKTYCSLLLVDAIAQIPDGRDFGPNDTVP